MGLDMYLYRRNRDAVLPPQPESGDDAEGWDNWCALYRVARGEEVAYWRKANAIHGWIVNNCAGGVDECQPIDVDAEQLAGLLALCKRVLADPSVGPNELPTTPGFFFGSYEYDDWYMSDLQETVDQLTKALSDFDPAVDRFTYQASW